MNEWVKRIRSSVQSVVDGKRRKSAASPTTADRKHTTATSRPQTVTPELELPPVEPPQLPGLTKQRARGPPRRRPSPRPSQQGGGDQPRTVSCPPADPDPARFAWGRDPSIDPALFFSDVVGRSMGDERNSTGSVWAADRRLGSIAESDDGRGSEGNGERPEGVAEHTDNGSGSDVARGSDSSSRLSEESQRASTESGAGSRSKDRECGDEKSADASGDKELASGDRETPAPNADAATGESEPPTSGAGGGRDSPVLHLTGGEVEGAPRRRFCSIL